MQTNKIKLQYIIQSYRSIFLGMSVVIVMGDSDGWCQDESDCFLDFDYHKKQNFDSNDWLTLVLMNSFYNNIWLTLLSQVFYKGNKD